MALAFSSACTGEALLGSRCSSLAFGAAVWLLWPAMVAWVGVPLSSCSASTSPCSFFLRPAVVARGEGVVKACSRRRLRQAMFVLSAGLDGRGVAAGGAMAVRVQRSSVPSLAADGFCGLLHEWGVSFPGCAAAWCILLQRCSAMEFIFRRLRWFSSHCCCAEFFGLFRLRISVLCFVIWVE